MGWPKERRNQSYAALRAVLHTLRDRLTVEEAAQLSAQLPMLIRGIYFEGWDPTDVPVKVHREEFLERVERQFPYEVEGGTELLVQRVLRALQIHVTQRRSSSSPGAPMFPRAGRSATWSSSTGPRSSTAPSRGR
jgi:uncharacterized protein (DUF2267 family)